MGLYMKRSDQSRRIFFWAFILYSAFIIYGSLVPFNLHLVSLSEALDLFLELRFMDLGRISRMDWTTNIVLGIPLSFFGLCWIAVSKHPVHMAIRAAIIIIFCLTISVSAEFLQIFFSSRVPTINDIVAQLIGAVIGVSLYMLFGDSLKGSIDEFLSTKVFDRKIGFLFSAYVLTLILLNVMPLDLSLSPVDIYRKWNQGQINLIPFAYKADASILIYNTVMDTLKWVPVPIFFVYLKGGKVSTAILFSMFIACSIESAQIFVMSRVTDVTDILTALAGSLMGGGLARKIKKDKNESEPSVKKRRPMLRWAIALLVLWMSIPVVIDWFPFDFSFDKAAVKRHLDGLSWIPFSNYQATNFYHAIASVVRKTLVFAVPGIMLAYVSKDDRYGAKQVNAFMVVIVSILVTAWAGLVEIGQFFLPGDVPDLTDILLAAFGFFIGYWVLKQVYGLNPK